MAEAKNDYPDIFRRRNTPPGSFFEITSAGVRTTTGEYEFDVIVLATGFDANTGGLTQIDIRDSDGVSLSDRWSDEVDAHLGLAVAGFPNMLFLYGPQSPTAFCNGPTCAEVQGDWVVALLSYLRDQRHTRIEATTDARAAGRPLSTRSERSRCW